MSDFLILFSVGAISRVIEHAPNFTPIGALIVFYASRKGLKPALALSLAIMIVSDIILGFNFASLFVYFGFASYALISNYFSKRTGLLPSAIMGSIAFFIISNFGVFLGPWYEHSLNGLLKCFTLAIPFFKNMLIADIAFISAIIIIEKAVCYKFKKTKIIEEDSWPQLFPRVILRKK